MDIISSINPTRTPIVNIIYYTESQSSPLLISFIVFFCLIIVGVITFIFVQICRRDRSPIYAEEDNPSDENNPGNAEIIAVYKIKRHNNEDD